MKEKKNSNNLYITQSNELNFSVFTLFPLIIGHVVVQQKIASSFCWPFIIYVRESEYIGESHALI